MSRAIRLEDLSEAELADRFGDVKAKGEAAEKATEALKAEFDRRKLDYARGLRFRVTKDTSTQQRFDVAAARQALGAEALKYLKSQSRTSWLVRPIEAEA